jgi:predicted nucleotidyltransferase
MTEKHSIPKQRSRASLVRKRNELARYKRVLGSHLPELRNRYGVRTLGIFGSFVRGEAADKSDLDILVEFETRRVTMFKSDHFLTKTKKMLMERRMSDLPSAVLFIGSCS